MPSKADRMEEVAHNRHSLKGASVRDLQRRKNRRLMKLRIRQIAKKWGTDNWE